MTITAVKPGGWDPEDVLTSDEMNGFQERLLKAIDGLDGGTYELQDDLVFDGPGSVVIANDLTVQNGATVGLGGTTALTGQFNVEAGGDINVKTGGEINVQGTGQIDVEASAFLNVTGIQTLAAPAELRVTSGAKVRLIGANALEVENGADLNVKLGGDVNVEGGGDINLASTGKINAASGSEVNLATLSILKITDVAFSGVHSLAALQHVPGQWDPWSGGAGFWLDNAADGAALIAFALPLTPGDTLTTVIVNLRGQAGVSGHAAVPATRPRATLLEIASDGTVTSLDAQNDPTGGADVAGYNAAHAITLSAGLLPRTVGARLVLTLRSEGGAGAEAGKTLLLGIGLIGVARSYRAASLLI